MAAEARFGAVAEYTDTDTGATTGLADAIQELQRTAQPPGPRSVAVLDHSERPGRAVLGAVAFEVDASAMQDAHVDVHLAVDACAIERETPGATPQPTTLAQRGQGTEGGAARKGAPKAPAVDPIALAARAYAPYATHVAQAALEHLRQRRTVAKELVPQEESDGSDLEGCADSDIDDDDRPVGRRDPTAADGTAATRVGARVIDGRGLDAIVPGRVPLAVVRNEERRARRAARLRADQIGWGSAADELDPKARVYAVPSFVIAVADLRRQLHKRIPDDGATETGRRVRVAAVHALRVGTGVHMYGTRALVRALGTGIATGARVAHWHIDDSDADETMSAFSGAVAHPVAVAAYVWLTATTHHRLVVHAPPTCGVGCHTFGSHIRALMTLLARDLGPEQSTQALLARLKCSNAPPPPFRVLGVPRV